MYKWTEFCLNNINIEDEAMEDLETFNNKFYSILNKRQQDVSQSLFLNQIEDEQNISITSTQLALIHYDNTLTKKFLFEKYLYRLMNESFNKSQLSSLMKDISKLASSSCIKVLAIIKSVRSNSTKEIHIKAIIDIITILLKK